MMPLGFKLNLCLPFMVYGRLRACGLGQSSARSRPPNPYLAAAVPDMLRKKPRSVARRKVLDAMRKESDRQLEELIRRRLAMPVEQRMNFLRKRLPGGGSCL